MNRNTTTRDRHRHIIAEGLHPSPYGYHPPCFHCGDPIDYDAHHHHPMSFQVDHVTPLSHAQPGEDLDTLDNKVPSHRKCNRAKSDKRGWRPGVTYTTTRNWRHPAPTG